MSTSPTASPFRQPKAVWAVAFACVISFMGIGLVDPILPALAQQLAATPAQVSLLFTSYLLITAVAMLVTGWVSSRIGAKATLVTGLSIIVVFAALAGASGSIGEIVGFRAGWGLGNALFIATSLAVIVASASGGFAGAIILYETALGVGIALGPLVGGLLGSVSWRAPFFGVAVLMAIALIATLVLLDKTPKPATKIGLLDPIRALRHRSLATIAVTAFAYNWGFFTLLAYSPYSMGDLSESASAPSSPRGACWWRSSRCSWPPRWNAASAPCVSSTTCSGCSRSTCSSSRSGTTPRASSSAR